MDSGHSRSVKYLQNLQPSNGSRPDPPDLQTNQTNGPNGAKRRPSSSSKRTIPPPFTSIFLNSAWERQLHFDDSHEKLFNGCGSKPTIPNDPQKGPLKGGNQYSISYCLKKMARNWGNSSASTSPTPKNMNCTCFSLLQKIPKNTRILLKARANYKFDKRLQATKSDKNDIKKWKESWWFESVRPPLWTATSSIHTLTCTTGTPSSPCAGHDLRLPGDSERRHSWDWRWTFSETSGTSKHWFRFSWLVGN